MATTVADLRGLERLRFYATRQAFFSSHVPGRSIDPKTRFGQLVALQGGLLRLSHVGFPMPSP